MYFSKHTQNNLSVFLTLSVLIHGLALYFISQNIAKKDLPLLKLDITKINAKFYNDSNSHEVIEKVIKKTTPISQAPSKAHPDKKQASSMVKPIIENQLKEPVIAEKITEEDKKLEPKDPKMIPINNSEIKGYKPSPIYPKRALRLKQQGVVIIDAEVDSNGLVTKINIIQTSGFAILDKSARNAVLKWKFDQTSINNSIILVRIPVEFIIN
ncbi:MAG: TonB family protein [Rickettsiales bacterium]|mgnify:FL=1|jgi:periplasmic protein TonB|nr:TonB family protein [Rickettsiales bacterium]